MSKSDSFLVFALVLCGMLVFVTSLSYAAGTGSPNSCVQCHSGLSGVSIVGVKSHSWSGSIHQQHGVTCEKCHGGDPSAEGMKEAHVGVLSSSNPKSPVYFKNIPTTCGKYHGAEFYKFTQSLHYKMLESTGEGPDCVTCHGSMVTRVLAPGSLVSVCDRCHNENMGISPGVPQKARAVLLLLRESKSLLDAKEKLHHPAEGTTEDRALRDAKEALHSANLEWHKFDLDAITNHLQEFYHALQGLPPEQPQTEQKSQP
jgi:hypothetical protein